MQPKGDQSQKDQDCKPLVAIWYTSKTRKKKKILEQVIILTKHLSVVLLHVGTGMDVLAISSDRHFSAVQE